MDFFYNLSYETIIQWPFTRSAEKENDKKKKKTKRMTLKFRATAQYVECAWEISKNKQK